MQGVRGEPGVLRVRWVRWGMGGPGSGVLGLGVQVVQGVQGVRTRFWPPFNATLMHSADAQTTMPPCFT